MECFPLVSVIYSCTYLQRHRTNSWPCFWGRYARMQAVERRIATLYPLLLCAVARVGDTCRKPSPTLLLTSPLHRSPLCLMFPPTVHICVLQPQGIPYYFTGQILKMLDTPPTYFVYPFCLCSHAQQFLWRQQLRGGGQSIFSQQQQPRRDGQSIVLV